jgi:hypothetical protein
VRRECSVLLRSMVGMETRESDAIVAETCERDVREWIGTDGQKTKDEQVMPRVKRALLVVDGKDGLDIVMRGIGEYK